MFMSRVFATSWLIFTLQANYAAGRRQSSLSPQDYQFEKMIVQLVLDLEWSAVTLFVDNATDLSNGWINELHMTNISTIIWMEDFTIFTANKLIRTHGDGFIVKGELSFVERIFDQVTQYAELINRSSALFTTEWLAIIPEHQFSQNQQVLSRFENVAVVAYSVKGNNSLWTMRHVKDDSRLTFVSILPPSHPGLTRQYILPNPTHGLGGRTLRVAVKESKYTVMKYNTSQQTGYQGIAMEILDDLSLRLNFSYIIVPLADDSWGLELDNGQWIGPIGMLIRKEVDLVVASISITLDRAAVTDATTPYMQDFSVIIYLKERSKTDSLAFLVQPFQSPVYALIAGGFLLTFLLLLLLERVGHRKECAGPCKNLQLMARNCEILFSGLLSKSSEEKCESRGGGVLVLTWLLLGLMLASVYSSKLTSSLAVREQKPLFSSLNDLIRNHGSFTWGFVGSSATESMLKSSSVKEFQEFYRKALKFAESDPTVLSTSEEEHMAKVTRGNYAYFTGNPKLYSSQNEYCDIAQVPDLNLMSSSAFYLQKGSPYTKPISEILNVMVDVGLIDYWTRKWTPEKRECPSDDEQITRALSLAQVQAAFYLAILGVTLAALVLGAEHLVRRISCSFSLQQHLPADPTVT